MAHLAVGFVKLIAWLGDRATVRQMLETHVIQDGFRELDRGSWITLQHDYQVPGTTRATQVFDEARVSEIGPATPDGACQGEIDWGGAEALLTLNSKS